MNWAKLTRNAASRKFDELRNNDEFKHGFLATSYSELRQAIVDNLQPFENSDLEAGAYDLEAGLTLYRVLKEKSSRFAKPQMKASGAICLSLFYPTM